MYFINFVNSENFNHTPFSNEITKTNAKVKALELPCFLWLL